MLYFTALYALSSLACQAQPDKMDLAKLQVNGLALTASKSQVAQRLGKPLAVVEPHYECGEHASQPGGERFYQLRYRQAVFIGNAKQGYDLESFTFAPAGPAKLTYGRQPLTAATTLQEFTHLFGPLKTSKNKDGSVRITIWKYDTSMVFIFKAGRLASFENNGVGC